MASSQIIASSEKSLRITGFLEIRCSTRSEYSRERGNSESREANSSQIESTRQRKGHGAETSFGKNLWEILSSRFQIYQGYFLRIELEPEEQSSILV